MPSAVSSFDTPHYGVTDMKVDYYGQRLATCSGTDICVWGVASSQLAKLAGAEKSQLLAQLRSEEEVNQICWADPTLGSMIASAGAEGHVVLWREVT